MTDETATVQGANTAADPAAQPLTGIKIVLDGQERELRFVPKRATQISRAFQGLRPAADRVGAFDMDAIATIVSIGLGRTTPAGVEQTEEEVFRAGVATLAQPVSDYLIGLAYGGRVAPIQEG